MIKSQTGPSRTGDIAEYYAVTWLWDQGYEVFRNCGCSGPIDIVAVGPDGNTILIDVKTANKSIGGNQTRSAYASRNVLQKQLGVVVLQFNPDTRQLKFTEHRDEETNIGHRDEQHTQHDLDLCDAGC